MASIVQTLVLVSHSRTNKTVLGCLLDKRLADMTRYQQRLDHGLAGGKLQANRSAVVHFVDAQKATFHIPYLAHSASLPRP